MTRTWRLCKERYLEDAFDGEGARRYGGRWNSPGHRVVYTADSAALATLEVLVNLEETALLTAYRLVPADVDGDLVEVLPVEELPGDWRQRPPPESTQQIGDAWLEERGSVGLSVPSAVVPGRTILLNPDHPRFEDVEIGEPLGWDVDPRLVGRG